MIKNRRRLFEITIKVSALDKGIWKSTFKYSGIFSGIFSTLITFWDISSSFKKTLFYILIILITLIYIFNLLYANMVKKLNFNLDGSIINIKEGDILNDKIYKDKNSIKVFSFNEYFDTLVDDKMISKTSLNGKFIKYKIKDVDLLNEKIYNVLSIKSIDKNMRRKSGEKYKYKLGTIFEYSDNVFLTALTHFDEKNRAILSMNDYMMFLMEFWDQLDCKYSGKNVIIPLFGSGITRINDKKVSKNQILQILLFSFWLSNVQLTTPSKLVILMDKKTNKEINYYKLKEWFNGLQK